MHFKFCCFVLHCAYAVAVYIVFIAIILYIIENLELLKLQSFLCTFCLILLNNLRFFYASHIILLVTSFCIY